MNKKITPEIQNDFFEQMIEEEFPNCSQIRYLWEKFIYSFIVMHTHEEMILDAMLAHCLEKEPCRYAYVEQGQVFNCQCGRCF